MYIVYLLSGLALLVFGAEVLVRYASALAARLGIPAIVVGLTIVAFGTSAPELAISGLASLAGQPDLALGNVIGSNIFNVLLILGISALISPLIINTQVVRIDVPLMVGISLLILLIASDGSIGRVDGALLLSGIVVYTLFQIVQGRASGDADSVEKQPDGRVLFDVLLLLAGLGLLVLGSRLFLIGAVDLARLLGLSELVIGLTIVAAGTSLPEAATSIIAVLRGQRDIAVGNVIGSNIFNMLGVLGLASVISPEGIAVARSTLVYDIPVMIVVAVACLPVFFKNNIIARWQGGVFVSYYVAYIVYLILAVDGQDTLGTLGRVIGYFALPLTAIAFGAAAVQRFRSR